MTGRVIPAIVPIAVVVDRPAAKAVTVRITPPVVGVPVVRVSPRRPAPVRIPRRPTDRPEGIVPAIPESAIPVVPAPASAQVAVDIRRGMAGLVTGF